MSDAQTIVEAYHQVDPSSGFVETTGKYATAFTAERKQQFIDVYVASGLRFKHTCKKLGISDHTVHHHISIDPEFKNKIDEAQAEYAEELEARQRNFALEPKQFMDRAMQLRCLLPGKYAREQNYGSSSPITINVSGDFLIDAKKRSEMIDAEIVREAQVARVEQDKLKIISTLPTRNESVEDQRV